jgi:integrase
LAQFLTPVQVSALVAATPWPYNVMVHVAAWSGLRAAELAGLQVGDVDLPDPPLNPNASAKTGHLRVERTARALGADVEYLSPKTKGSYRRVPLILATTALLRDYLAEHPRADEPTAPLFPAMVLKVPRPTGRTGDARRWRSGQRGANSATSSATAKARARRQATALAELTVAEAEKRLMLDWTALLWHPTFYKAIFRPAVLRANRLAPAAALPAELKFHSLRHTYASLCVAAGIKPTKLSGRMGHGNVRTTLDIYVHLFPDDDASEDMAALGAMGQAKPEGNVVALRR